MSTKRDQNMKKDAFNINKRVEEFCGISNSAIKILKAHITSCFYLSFLFSLWSRQPIFHGGKKLNSQKLFENGFGFLFFGGGESEWLNWHSHIWTTASFDFHGFELQTSGNGSDNSANWATASTVITLGSCTNTWILKSSSSRIWWAIKTIQFDRKKG